MTPRKFLTTSRRALLGRARQRGTAMMEALMVNIVLIILLAGVIYFQATYSAKIRSDQNTRAYAFTYALHGCSEVPENEALGIEESGGEPSSSTEGDDDTKSDLAESGNEVPSTGSSLDDDPAMTQNVFGQTSVGTVNATSTVQLKGFSMLNISGREMTSSTRVQCNLVPATTSNIVKVAKQAALNLANW